MISKLYRSPKFILRLYSQICQEDLLSFQREVKSRLPSSIGGKNYFTIELIDVNEDNKLDLLLGGHEWEGSGTIVLINPGNNNFSNVTPIIIPEVPNEGVVFDFTFTGTGNNRMLWILRTSGGDGTFYQSRVIQKVLWHSLKSTVVSNERPAQWIPWIIPTIINGIKVIACDDKNTGVSIFAFE